MRGVVVKQRFPVMPEEDVHRTVVAHLERRAPSGVVWLHPANGGARSKGEAGRFKAMGVVAGIPDLLLYASGVSYALELKSDTGVLRSSQRLQLERLARAGVKVAVAHGLDQALGQLKEWGLLR